MAQNADQFRIPSEREFVMGHVRTGLTILLVAVLMAVIGVYLTTYYRGPDVLYPALIKAFVAPFVIVPVCTLIHVKQTLGERRKVVRLYHLAMTDDMTGLPNRRAFMNAACKRLDQIVLDETGLGVLLIDLDHFKLINDTYGHNVGDSALIHTANIIRSSLTPEATVGRLGGEEFAVIFTYTHQAEIETTAERIRHAIAHSPFQTSTHEITVTASVGVSAVVEGDTVSSALCRADNALYDAKRAGRNCLSIAA